VGKNVANTGRREATDRFLAAAPVEYRAAFESDERNSGALVLRFHAKPRKKRAR
jgi:hypothetical protein